MIDVSQVALLNNIQQKIEETHRLLNEYRGLMKRTVEIATGIGRNLQEFRDILPHGHFLPLLQSEFGLSQRTAYNFISLAEAETQGKFANFANFDLPLSVAYELAPQSTPTVVVEMVATGQIPATIPAIREAKRELQQPQLTSEPSFTQWQQDNLALGLDKWADPLPDDEEEETSKPVVKSATLTALQSSETNEWYTPAQYIEAAREVLGTIDLDPASNAFANETVQAEDYFDSFINGLEHTWDGRVWLNPPYGFTDGRSNQEVWSSRLIEQYKAGITTAAVLLVNANTEAKWFQPLYNFTLCFTNHRIRFYNADGESSQPTQGNAFVYFGPHPERFISIFKQFGVIVRRVDSE